MAKGYWISAHRRAPDPDKSAAYREIAMPAIEAAGGKFLAADAEPQARESGVAQRTIIIEFPSYEAALGAYESEEYQRALAALADGAERDLRIVKGVGE